MSPIEVHWPLLHDRVLVPNGREGEVIGFYRREDEAVLVSFPSGKPSVFLTADVRPLA